MYRRRAQLRSFHRRPQQSGCLGMSLLDIAAVQQETGIFQIKEVNPGRLRIGIAESFFEKPAPGTATDHDAIKSFPGGASGKLADISFGITCKREYRWNDGKNQDRKSTRLNSSH